MQVLEKLCADALPCYKEFASLMLFLDSYPPVPLSTWKGGTHRSGFGSYEGAALPTKRNSLRSYYLNHPTPTLPSRGGSVKET